MKYSLVLAAVCAAVAYAADSVMEAANKEPAMAVSGVKAPALSTNLADNPGLVRPDVLEAFDANAELEDWMKQGNALHFPVLDDEGKVVNASVNAVSFVSFSTVANKFQDKIKFHFFNKYDEKDIRGYEVTDAKELLAHGWDKDLPVKIIIHGFTNSIVSPAIQVVKNAFLKSGKYNVIGVDWGKLCAGINYLQARYNVPGSGAQVGEFVDKLIALELTKPEQIHILGHSLGAHVAGIAGKHVTRGNVARITGFDPAGPLFQLTDNNGIVYHTDADLVDIYHTNMHWLGKSAQLGDIDFYLNGGIHQPECAWKEIIIAGNGFGPCSHSRSFEYYAETLSHGYSLEGQYCPVLPSSPDSCLRHKALYTAQTGHYLDFKRGGSYYLQTQWPKPKPFTL